MTVHDCKENRTCVLTVPVDAEATNIEEIIMCRDC